MTQPEDERSPWQADAGAESAGRPAEESAQWPPGPDEERERRDAKRQWQQAQWQQLAPDQVTQQGQYPPMPSEGYYGYPPQSYAPQGYPPQGYAPQGYGPPPSNPLGVAGFVTALIGVVLFFVPFLDLALGITGLALSAMGMARGRRTGAGSGLAIAGLVLGIIATLFGILVVITIVVDGW